MGGRKRSAHAALGGNLRLGAHGNQISAGMSASIELTALKCCIQAKSLIEPIPAQHLRF
jgi:hypothetical protein